MEILASNWVLLAPYIPIAAVLLVGWATPRRTPSRPMDFRDNMQRLDDDQFRHYLAGVDIACRGGLMEAERLWGRWPLGWRASARFEGWRTARRYMWRRAEFDSLMAFLQSEAQRRLGAGYGSRFGFISTYQAGITDHPNPAAARRSDITMLILLSACLVALTAGLAFTG